MLQILEQAVLGGGFRGTFEAMEPYSAVRLSEPGAVPPYMVE